MDPDRKRIIVASVWIVLIIIIAAGIFYYAGVGIKNTKSDPKILPQYMSEIGENGVPTYRFIRLLDTMRVLDVFNDETEIWTPIQSKGIYSSNVNFGKISSEQIVPLFDESVPEERKKWITDYVLNYNLTMLMNYGRPCLKYILGFHTKYTNTQVASLTFNFNDTCNIEKVWIYPQFSIIHIIKTRENHVFEKLFGNFAEYYMLSQTHTTPYAMVMVGKGEFKNN